MLHHVPGYLHLHRLNPATHMVCKATIFAADPEKGDIGQIVSRVHVDIDATVFVFAVLPCTLTDQCVAACSEFGCCLVLHSCVLSEILITKGMSNEHHSL